MGVSVRRGCAETKRAVMCLRFERFMFGLDGGQIYIPDSESHNYVMEIFPQAASMQELPSIVSSAR